jgi:AraC-like DNA-binding protein
MNRVWFEEDDPRFDAHVRLFGVGLKEVMPAGFLSRRRGLPAYVCILFHDAVLVEVMGRKIEVLPETMILWDKGRPHYYGDGRRSWRHSWVVFLGEDWASEEMRPIFERPQWFEDSKPLLTYFASLLREFQSFDKPDLPIIAANIQILVREMSRSQEHRHQPAADPVKVARRWITANLRKKLPVNAVARHAGLSPSRIEQLFRARLNCSVQEFIEGERLREARYWLMHTGLRIKEIAERTGFSDAFYFSRRFSKTFKKNPRDYRKTHHGERQEEH